MMVTITVFDPTGQVDFSFPITDKPVRLGKGEGCHKILSELPANGPQLEIEFETDQNRLLVRRLSSASEVCIGDQKIGGDGEIWSAGSELRIGSYRLTNDLGAANGPISSQDRFSVEAKTGENYLSLTPGVPMNCSLRVTNHSDREVTGALLVEINGQPVKWCTGAGNMGRAFTPNEERTFTLTFTAPTNSTVKAGTYQLDVTAIPDSRVEKFRSGGNSITVIVERFTQHSHRIDRLLRFNPLLGFIFRSARFNFEVNNIGNCDDTYSLAAAPNSDSDERTEYRFIDTGAPKASLEVGVGNSNAAQLQVKRPLLWFPMWKGHRFNASIANSANQIIRFTQLSVIWLVLIIAGLGWLGWLGMKILMGPGFAQPPIASLSKLDVNREGGNPDDPIKAGDSVTVTWNAPNASVVDIYQVGDNDALKTIVKDHKAEDQKFTITGGFDKMVKLRVVARNSFGQAEKDIDVPIDFVPAKVQFNPTSPVRLVLDPSSGGQSPGIKIGWVVEGKAISGVTFDGEAVEKIDSRYKYPSASTTYDLAVNYSNNQKSLVRKFDVVVIIPTPTPPPSPTPTPPAPECFRFRPEWPVGSDKAAKRNANSIKKGDQVLLVWEVKGADSIRIMQNDGVGDSNLTQTNQASGQVDISPQRTTSYSLIAVKAGQQITCRPVTVTVNCREVKPTPPFYEWKPCKK